MFTGIIETVGIVKEINHLEKNLELIISVPFVSELILGQSIAHNGVCLTVTQINNDSYHVTAIEETLQKTNLNDIKIHDAINIERCMPANGRFDGHIVQGHVDTTATCTQVNAHEGSWNYQFEFNSNPELIVPKGSICINGVSLTVVDCVGNLFSVAIIPYTFENTNFKQIQPGSRVNIEFDIIGKYIQKMLVK